MIAILRTVRGTSRVPFEKIAKRIVGSRYELSLVLCGDSLARRMNRTYRKKKYTPNVLAFPLSARAGEIFLNVRKAELEARTLGTAVHERIAFLFIHACLHLKGYDHGAAMEKMEKKHLKNVGAEKLSR